MLCGRLLGEDGARELWIRVLKCAVNNWLVQFSFELINGALCFPGLSCLLCWVHTGWCLSETRNILSDEIWAVCSMGWQWENISWGIINWTRSGLWAVINLEMRFTAQIQIFQVCTCIKESAGIIPDPTLAPSLSDMLVNAAILPSFCSRIYPSWVWAASLPPSGLQYQSVTWGLLWCWCRMEVSVILCCPSITHQPQTTMPIVLPWSLELTCWAVMGLLTSSLRGLLCSGAAHIITEEFVVLRGWSRHHWRVCCAQRGLKL